MKPKYAYGFYLVESLRGSHTGVHAARNITEYHANASDIEEFARLADICGEDDVFRFDPFWKKLESTDQFNDCINRMIAENEKIGLAVFDRDGGLLRPAVFIVFTE
jgi:hypothetical protein